MPYAAGEPSLGGGLGDQVYSRLLGERIIFLGQQVDDPIANQISAQLLLLAAEDPKRDIHLYINSPGGSVTAGMAIYDTMQWVSCDVATYCIGQCASMGSLLLAAGAKGKRNALPHGRIMIHQPLAGMEGTATDILIHAEEFIRMKKQLNQAFNTFEVVEHLPPQIDDPEHTSYRMKVKVDDNGHVRLKTVEKEPGQDWDVHVEEYDRGDKKAIGQ